MEVGAVVSGAGARVSSIIFTGAIVLGVAVSATAGTGAMVGADVGAMVNGIIVSTGAIVLGVAVSSTAGTGAMVRVVVGAMVAGVIVSTGATVLGVPETALVGAAVEGKVGGTVVTTATTGVVVAVGTGAAVGVVIGTGVVGTDEPGAAASQQSCCCSTKMKQPRVSYNKVRFLTKMMQKGTAKDTKSGVLGRTYQDYVSRGWAAIAEQTKAGALSMIGARGRRRRITTRCYWHQRSRNSG